MNHCPSRDQELFLLSRGELSPAKGLGLRAHLAVCPACRARVADFRRVSGMLQESFTGTPPLPPLWRQMPVFPISALIVAAVVSTAFVVYRRQNALAVLPPASVRASECARDSKPPPVPHRDPKSFLTYGNQAGPNGAPLPKSKPYLATSPSTRD